MSGVSGNGAQIKNVILENPSVKGGYNVGAVVGMYGSNNPSDNHAKPLTGCAVLGGSVVGTGNFVGGVVGDLYSDVEKCYSTCSVNGGGNVGGVAGHAGDAAVVTQCYSKGSVVGAGNYVGGVVGRTGSAAVTQCYSTGSVTGTGNYVGGVAGNAGGAVTSCAALGRAVSGGSVPVARVAGYGMVSGSYAWSGMTVKLGSNTADIILDGTADSANGADITYDGSNLSTQFSTIFGDDTATWNFTDDGLPTLKNVGGAQSSALPLWIGDIIYIYDAAGLKAFADGVNNETLDTSDKTYKLANNIDLSAYANWTPIDGDGDKFKGTFDGNGFIIRGLKIDNSGANNQGLFGWVNGVDGNGAQIKNVIIENPSVKGGYNVGAAVGWYGDTTNYTESLTGCAVLGGSVVGTGNFVGGVVGNAYGTVTKCYSTCSVNGGANVGGVVGAADAVTQCYSTGSVVGTGGFVGGVVGGAGSAVTQCYSTGSVTGTSAYVGGVVGNAGGAVTSCAALGRAVSGSDTYVARVAGGGGSSSDNLYAWSDMTLKVDSSPAATISGGAINNTNGADITYSSSLSPQFNIIFTGDVSAWDFTDDGLPTLKNVGGAQSSALPLWITSVPELNTTYIYDAADLKALADDLKDNKIDTSGQTYKLASDIDLSAYDSWTPIGTITSPFRGIFDGQNHTITGLKIDSSAGEQGLFGVVNGGSWSSAQIKNLIIENPTVKGGFGTGAVVGQYGDDPNYTLPLTDCAVLGGSVEGTDYLGGVVGKAYGAVTGCYSTCSVEGGDYVGGVVGWANTTAAVTGCYSTGSVEGAREVGGVVGHALGAVTGCCSKGSVVGTVNYAGGVVGYALGAVTGCYSKGSVVGDSYVGGVVGRATTAATVTGCYSTCSVEGASTVGGVVGYANGAVEKCYSAGSIVGTSNNVGGVVGYANGNVLNCYSTGSVEGAGYVGGVVGKAYGAVTNCYSAGSVKVTSGHVGGVVGYADSGSSVTSCVALGRAVSGSNNANRVAGGGDAISGCYAWSGMTVKNGGSDPATIQDGTADSLNGADIISSDGLLYYDNSFFAWTGFDLAVWELRNTEKNKLPKLKDTLDDPVLNLAQAATKEGWTPPAPPDDPPAPPADPSGGGSGYIGGYTPPSGAGVTMPAAPTFTAPTQDEAVTAFVGGSVTFTVSANNASRYQWYINTGSGWRKIDGANEPSYTTAPVTPENSGYRYYCAAVGDGGSALSHIFTLTVADNAQLPPQTGDGGAGAVGIAMLALAVLVLASQMKSRSARLRRE